MSLIIWNLPNLMSIELVMLSNHLILCHLFSFCLQSFQSSSKYSGLIFFRIDWFDLLAVQGTLKSLQHHSQKHQFFGLNFLYGPTLTSVFDISISSVQFSRSVVSDSLWPHELQHARPPCPSPAPRVYPNPCPSSWWCYPAISSSVIPFSFHLQSFPASGFFQWFSSLHQVAKILEFQLQHQSFQWISGLISFRIDWLDLLAVQGTLKSLLQQFKSINSSVLSFLYSLTLTSIYDYWKSHSLD